MKRREFLRGTFNAASSLLLSQRSPSRPQSPSIHPVQFTDVTVKARLQFKHFSGATGQKYLMETMGPGCAFFDYDGDGYLDIYLVNGGSLPGAPAGPEVRNALYRNNRDGTFTDVTEKAGVRGRGYGMGVIAGDYNNDGFVDLFVTNFGSSILYRNNGDGTFTDVTERAGVNNKKWGSSAAFFDYDNDGFLDLFVCNYVDFSIDYNVPCGPGPRTYCSPQNFKGSTCVLYHNNGDGTFTNVSERSGISSVIGKALGVITADFNGDGYQDIYVANDELPNFLFINNKDGTFQEVGTLAGVAYTGNGQVQSSMGVAAADYDGDGRLDLVITTLSFEGFTLYHNDGNTNFSDQSFADGVGAPSLLLTGMGVGFFDYDNDGDEDIITANSHVTDNVQEFTSILRYLEPMLLLENVGGKYTDVTRERGDCLSVPRASRGLALGDFDNDGWVDLLMANCNSAPTLIRNQGGNGNHWIKIQPVGKRTNRDGIGVKVRLTAGGKTQIKEMVGGGSYLSSSDPRVHFGIGPNERVEKIEVRWPRGGAQVLENVIPDRILKIEEP